jgi:hypothetical protein
MRPNKRIDTKLSTPLFNLPLSTISSGDPPTSLAVRNLLRHVTWSQPSGQAIARAIGAAPLARGDLSELSGYGIGLDANTPLWYHVLKEAQVRTDGLTLGPVGGRIVAEVSSACCSSTPSPTSTSPTGGRRCPPAAAR